LKSTETYRYEYNNDIHSADFSNFGSLKSTETAIQGRPVAALFV